MAAFAAAHVMKQNSQWKKCQQRKLYIHILYSMDCPSPFRNRPCSKSL